LVSSRFDRDVHEVDLIETCSDVCENAPPVELIEPGATSYELKWTTVSPSVTAGGLAVARTFSLTHSAVRREDSAVPVVSWQTVTVRPPSPRRSKIAAVSGLRFTTEPGKSVYHELRY
jgi:hypothetical protein